MLGSFITANVTGRINTVVINVRRNVEFCVAYRTIVPMVVFVRRPYFARRVRRDVNFRSARANVPVARAIRLPCFSVCRM